MSTSSRFFNLILVSILVMIIISCDANEKPKSSEVKTLYPTTPAFKDYQNKRLKEFESNITNTGIIEGLTDLDVMSLVMDWNLGKGRYATLSVLRNGHAKVFSSTGAKHIDIKHENVLNEVNRFFNYASTQLVNAKKYKNTRLPEEDHFTFYFKTNAGVSMAEGFIGDVQNKTSPWRILFEQANSLISEVRATDQDFNNNPDFE